MKKSKGRRQQQKRPGTARRKANRQFLPALAAVGGACGLAATPASALELGAIRVDSALGQPLRASIAYALAPNEELYNYCIFLRPGSPASGIPAVRDARITVTDNAIVLNGRAPIREPLLSLQLSVDCAYTARLAREYTLMIDPALPSEGELAPLSAGQPTLTPLRTATVTSADVPADIRPAPVVRRPTRRPQDTTPIAPGSRYLVKPGDSLSQIVARIENRNLPLWPAVDAIFAANPHAFLDNDPNLLKAGSRLDIPDLSGTSAVVSGADTAPARQHVAPDRGTSAYGGATVSQTATSPAQVNEAATNTESTDESEPVVEDAVEAEPVATVADEAQLIAEPANEPSSAARTSKPELRPGDVVIGTDNPFVVPLGADDGVVDIPDSELEGPQVSRPVPTVAVTQADDGGVSGGWSWLLWLGGAGIALILGLFMFGRQLRERFGGVSIAIPEVPARRRDDQPTPRSIVADIDFNFDADTLTPRKIDLDADLADGSGLQDASDMDVAQDFGFSATDTAVDMEITEQAAKEEKPLPTDVIPPQARDEETILDSEVLPDEESAEIPELEVTDEQKVALTGEAETKPEEEEEDYSLSMRIDATRQFMDDNTATTRDLQAVLVETDVHDADDTSEYSIDKEADYQILEQDYEEELSATQALNKEIEEAARALAEQMGETDDAKTAEMPVSGDHDTTAELTSNVPESLLDLTVDMPADEDATLDVEAVEPKKSEAS